MQRAETRAKTFFSWFISELRENYNSEEREGKLTGGLKWVSVNCVSKRYFREPPLHNIVVSQYFRDTGSPSGKRILCVAGLN
jgi:hypothetical protein